MIFLKWSCLFVNAVSGDDDTTPMNCEDSGLQRIHFPIPKEEEMDTSDGMESSGPWDALIYMKDPGALMQISSSAEAWESQDYEELE